MFNFPKKLQRRKSKSKSNRETSVAHSQEFLLRVKHGNEEEALIPIWIPLSILAKGAAISSGANEDLGELVSSVVIGHGNMVARRQSTQQHVKVDTYREVLLAAKISALTLLQANANAEAANAVECAVMEGARQLLANIYANSVVNLDPNSSMTMTDRCAVRKIALADSTDDIASASSSRQLYNARSAVSLSEDEPEVFEY